MIIFKMLINIPDFSLILLIGASSSGKSTFARRHFLKTEIISSDCCRGWVSDDELNQNATEDAFNLLNMIVELRLKRKKLTVVSVLQLAMDMEEDGSALVITGNHEAELERWLTTSQTSLTHGLDKTVVAIQEQGEEFKERVLKFISRMVSHYVLDDGRLVVAHAGIPEAMQGRTSGAFVFMEM